MIASIDHVLPDGRTVRIWQWPTLQGLEGFQHLTEYRRHFGTAKCLPAQRWLLSAAVAPKAQAAGGGWYLEQITIAETSNGALEHRERFDWETLGLKAAQDLLGVALEFVFADFLVGSSNGPGPSPTGSPPSPTSP